MPPDSVTTMATNATKTSKTANIAADPELATRKAPTAKIDGQLRKLAAGCCACELGEEHHANCVRRRPSPAKIMFAGDRSKVYVTNVVKHFQWSAAERGKRRIHKEPSGLEIQVCRPWIEAEIRIVRPQVLVCLGATAAPALLGKSFRVNTLRGQFVDSELAPYATATIHPSSILRAPDDAARQAQMAAVVIPNEYIIP